MEKTTKRDVYAIVTDRIIEQLEKGMVPWKQTWACSGMPQNLISRKPYRGMNLMLLSMLGYTYNFFLTEKQLKELGGTPHDNAKPHIVVYWLWPDENDTESRKSPILRYYRVFNVSQCNGIPPELIPTVDRPNDTIATADRIVEEMPLCPQIEHTDRHAYYDPQYDFINMPRINTFDNSESYYAVLFHELVHSTGHPLRLSRKGVTEKVIFGSENYSIEELIAEIGACYLQSLAGIEAEPTSTNISYLQSWLKVLKDDKKFIVYASSYAQKAVDYILNRKWNDTDNEEAHVEAVSTPPVEEKKKRTRKKETAS